MNPKQREESSLNGKIGYLCVEYVISIPNAMKRVSSVWNNYQTHKKV